MKTVVREVLLTHYDQHRHSLSRRRGRKTTFSFQGQKRKGIVALSYQTLVAAASGDQALTEAVSTDWVALGTT